MAGGFRPVNNLDGADYTGGVVTYGVDSGHASLLAVGDLVRITGQSDANGLQEVDAAAAAQTITGCIVAIDRNISDLEQSGLPASTAGTVKVAVGRNLLMEAPTSAAVAAADVGGNADIVATAATASGGLVNSNMTVNTGSVGSATAQIRIEGLKDGGTAAGSTVYCRINESTFDTVGV